MRKQMCAFLQNSGLNVIIFLSVIYVIRGLELVI